MRSTAQRQQRTSLTRPSSRQASLGLFPTCLSPLQVCPGLFSANCPPELPNVGINACPSRSSRPGGTCSAAHQCDNEVCVHLPCCACRDADSCACLQSKPCPPMSPLRAAASSLAPQVHSASTPAVCCAGAAQLESGVSCSARAADSCTLSLVPSILSPDLTGRLLRRCAADCHRRPAQLCRRWHKRQADWTAGDWAEDGLRC